MLLDNRVTLKERACQIKWGWYSMSMATGGISVLLHRTPHQFTGLEVIGKIIYIFNLAFFLVITACMAVRFKSRPTALKESFRDGNESYYAPTCLLAIATIILGAQGYGVSSCGPWLPVALRIVFWIYVALSTLSAVFHNWYLYHLAMAKQQPFPIAQLLPSFPAMLSGTIASSIAANQPRDQAIPILIGGVTLQGFGFLMSLLIYAEYQYFLAKHGLPEMAKRPQMFIAVGPWSFTALALIGMAKESVKIFPSRYIISYADPMSAGNITVSTGDIALVMASFFSIFVWTIAFFHLCIAAISVLSSARLFGGAGAPPMSVVYWGMVFPNTGFIIATISIGEVLQSPAILWVTSVLTVLQVIMWLGVGGATILAVARRQMLWPEDVKRGNEDELS
ncbi:C4-dicarboxylate transporter/malic acid transport protein [Penicillium italicum]|uniref:C4-dicarboxylate transporter/malic acid transport protein n=1 Tax=Penicillium italicum TaxID=40296 RepID=A0A0A2LHR5_PENIT|nr:C4-dicarboxylate transporter/malic acid transport protein [Penicillium italicum]